MEPMVLSEMNVIPMSCLYFNLPKTDYGRDDIAVSIEYARSDLNRDEVYCWAWAQVGDAFLRGKVDEYTVAYVENEDELIQSIVSALNNSERFRESLHGFIASISQFYPNA